MPPRSHTPFDTFVVVHGGAGFHSHSPESERNVKRGLKRACKAALDALATTQGSVDSSLALDGVQAAIKVLEDDESFNAGFGSNLTVSGSVECDASVMDDQGRFGGVGSVSGVKNPIALARSVLEYSKLPSRLGRIPPLTLVSSGAYEFATTQADSVARVRPEELVSPRARKEWEHWCERLSSVEGEGGTPYKGLEDTVGAVVSVAVSEPGGPQLGRTSNAAGVSSGGILLKLPGRLGEAATFGAGCWAALNVAVSVSGTGEQIVRTSLARSLGIAVQQCLAPSSPSTEEQPDVHQTIENVMTNEFLSRPAWLRTTIRSAVYPLLPQDSVKRVEMKWPMLVPSYSPTNFHTRSPRRV